MITPGPVDKSPIFDFARHREPSAYRLIDGRGTGNDLAGRRDAWLAFMLNSFDLAADTGAREAY